MFEKVYRFEKEKDEMEINEEEVLKVIEKAKNRKETVGVGNVADVYASETDENICYKINLRFKEGHIKMEEEVKLHEEVSRIEDENVTVPEPYIFGYDRDDNGALIMERLNAVSIEQLIIGNLDLPDNFEFKSFFRQLKEFFNKMHSKNIYHRDAHKGNIMIDLETGKPCVIDFGLSKKTLLSTEDPYRFDDTVISSDEDRILEVQRELRDYILSNKKV